MRLGYVCTNYNSSAVTLHAIETLRKNNGHDVHIVVVDNASKEIERGRLKSIVNSQTHVICLTENVGYFAGLNVGIKYLRASNIDVDWIVIGNNDLEFSDDFCDKLEGVIPELKKYAVISPDIVTGDDEHQNPHVISGISKFREILYDVYYSNYYVGMALQKLALNFRRLSERKDELEWRTARPIYQGHGSVYIIGPRFFELFEELWAPTFIMSEEFFLSKQLSDAGENIFYDPRISIRHLWHASLSGLPNKIRWELARDAHRIYRKYVKAFSILDTVKHCRRR